MLLTLSTSYTRKIIINGFRVPKKELLGIAKKVKTILRQDIIGNIIAEYQSLRMFLNLLIPIRGKVSMRINILKLDEMLFNDGYGYSQLLLMMIKELKLKTSCGEYSETLKYKVF